MGLTEADLQLISEYREFGVLDNLDTHRLSPREGLTIVMCGDPDQHPEAYEYQKEDIIKVGFQARIHPPAPLGGALRLAPDSPVNRHTPGYDHCLMYDIQLINQKAGVNTVALYVHAPCKLASLFGLNFADIVRHAFEAKRRIKQEIPGINAAVFCHIDDGTSRKTWFVCRARWEKYHLLDPFRALQKEYPDRVQMVSTIRH